MNTKEKWDFFVCHANEDKDEIVRPLANALIKDGFSVWFDEFSLTLGDSLSKSIDQGLSNSRYGIVIISPSFFAKKWPQRELNALSTMEIVKGVKKILPVWHNVTQDFISRFSPVLADKIGSSTSKGFDNVIKDVKRAFSSDSREEFVDAIVIDRVLRPIIECLVTNPNFSLKYIEGEKTTIIELEVSPEDLGRIVGKEGRVARALRTILGCVSASKIGKMVVLEIIEPG